MEEESCYVFFKKSYDEQQTKIISVISSYINIETIDILSPNSRPFFYIITIKICIYKWCTSVFKIYSSGFIRLFEKINILIFSAIRYNYVQFDENGYRSGH